MTQAADPKALEALLRDAVSDLGLQLSERQVEQLAIHFSLLLRWNRKINLTSLQRPEGIATRHFQESLFLAKVLPPRQGLMIDVGSGAGFPGLPLKVAWPSVETVLLEPHKRKAAFLKEAVRGCGLDGVEVRMERLEAAANRDLRGRAFLVTMRGVGASKKVMDDLVKLLQPAGQLAMFLGASDAAGFGKLPDVEWEAPIAIPHSARRVILVGRHR